MYLIVVWTRGKLPIDLLLLDSHLHFTMTTVAVEHGNAASSDADTAIELLSEVVTWSVLVGLGRQ